MKRTSIFRMRYLLIALLSLSACKNDTGNAAEKVIGRWEILEATRNNRPTESLSELYFEFTADGKLLTNIAGIDETLTYEIKKDKISQKGSSLGEVHYRIESIEENAMIISSELRSFSFRFSLQKVSAKESLQDNTEEQLQ